MTAAGIFSLYLPSPHHSGCHIYMNHYHIHFLFFIVFRSPTDSKIWNSELTKHLQFDLVDTSGMTEDQLKEIPYTVVETNAQNRKRNGNTTNSLKVHHKNSYGNIDRVDRIRG